MKKGFTLVELSIVMIIIGLLVAGTVVGNKLIEASKIQKVVSEFTNLRSAYYTFKTTYGEKLPGDFADASTFWGLDCDGASSGSNTCSGNGDGEIDWNQAAYSGGNVWQEAIRSTYHLKKAGLIYDDISGEGDPVGTGKAGFVPGTNIPISSWPGAGYSVWTKDVSSEGNHTAIFAGGYVSESWNFTVKFTPAQAHLLDKKMDDGLPQTGKFRGASFYGADSSGAILKACTTCTEATANNCHNVKTYAYDLDIATSQCLPALILETN